MTRRLDCKVPKENREKPLRSVEEREKLKEEETKKKKSLLKLQKEVNKMPIHSLSKPPETDIHSNQQTISIDVDGVELGGTQQS